MKDFELSDQAKTMIMYEMLLYYYEIREESPDDKMESIIKFIEKAGEKDLIDLICRDGYMMHQAAKRLHYSDTAVKVHKRKVLRKAYDRYKLDA